MGEHTAQKLKYRNYSQSICHKSTLVPTLYSPSDHPGHVILYTMQFVNCTTCSLHLTTLCTCRPYCVYIYTATSHAYTYIVTLLPIPHSLLVNTATPTCTSIYMQIVHYYCISTNYMFRNKTSTRYKTDRIENSNQSPSETQ